MGIVWMLEKHLYSRVIVNPNLYHFRFCYKILKTEFLSLENLFTHPNTFTCAVTKDYFLLRNTQLEIRDREVKTPTQTVVNNKFRKYMNYFFLFFPPKKTFWLLCSGRFTFDSRKNRLLNLLHNFRAADMAFQVSDSEDAANTLTHLPSNVSLGLGFERKTGKKTRSPN